MKYFKKILLLSLSSILLLSCISGCGNPEQNADMRENNFAKGRLSKKFLNSLTNAQLAAISNFMYYEDCLQKGIEKGERWVYTNSSKYVPQKETFDHMLEAPAHGGNCAMGTAWVIFDLGILNEGQRFWGGDNGEFKHEDEVREQLEVACDITEFDFVPFKEIYESGDVQPGDMFLAKGHTFVWLGDGKFFAVGHDSHYHVDSDVGLSEYCPNTAVYESWLVNYEECGNRNSKVTYRLRLKPDWMPKQYRNQEGKLVDVVV